MNIGEAHQETTGRDVSMAWLRAGIEAVDYEPSPSFLMHAIAIWTCS